jgi:predicted lipoprotein with Yx(FWY)xxD motif
MRNRWWVTAALTVPLVLLAACGSSSSGGSSGSSAPSSSSASASSSGLKTAKTSMGTVLTNAKGFTLYWFSPDTPATSKCSGGCASAWPPVPGPVSAASGVSLSGKLATVTRSDGSKQETYNGHPLYTFSADSGPGKTGGNGISAFGGTWHAVTTSGAAPASSPSSGGGY